MRIDLQRVRRVLLQLLGHGPLLPAEEVDGALRVDVRFELPRAVGLRARKGDAAQLIHIYGFVLFELRPLSVPRPLARPVTMPPPPQ